MHGILVIAVKYDCKNVGHCKVKQPTDCAYPCMALSWAVAWCELARSDEYGDPDEPDEYTPRLRRMSSVLLGISPLLQAASNCSYHTSQSDGHHDTL